MTYTKLFGSILLVGFLAVSCGTEKKATTTVTKVDEMEKIDQGMLYALPQTELFFNVKVIKTTVIPGPYNNYAAKFLGLSSVPHNYNTFFEIEDIDIERHTDVDYNQLYAIEPQGKFSIIDKNYTEKGWILPLDNDFSKVAEENFFKDTDYSDEIHYTDLSVRKFYGQETRKVYERVWQDSIYARVPTTKVDTIQKNIDKKAEEAANFIFMIRKKRFELISGMGDYYPEGAAMKEALDEMDTLENRYLELFTGKKKKDTLTYTFHVIPDQQHITEPNILFRFSHTDGFHEPDSQRGTPVWIELDKLDNHQGIEKFAEKLKSNKSSLYFRVPSKMHLKLKLADKVIAEKYLNIFQFGSITKIPLDYLNDQKIIEFYK
ncbi:MAG: DUF4831 family protein [Bacteroidales bacterium]